MIMTTLVPFPSYVCELLFTPLCIHAPSMGGVRALAESNVRRRGGARRGGDGGAEAKRAGCMRPTIS